MAREFAERGLKYAKLTKLPQGLLITFNVPLLKDGVCSVVNVFPSPSPS